MSSTTGRKKGSNEASTVGPQRLGETIRAFREARMSQAELGKAIGRHRGAPPVPQTTVSRWEKGLVQLSVDDVHLIERALGLELGTILVAAGYVSANGRMTVDSAILADAALPKSLRQTLAAHYLALRGR